MKHTKTILFFLAVIGLSLTCAMAQNANVYVGGISDNKATGWINGTPFTLSTGNGAVYSVVVDNGVVYAAGVEIESSKVIAKMWKNGIPEYTISNSTNTWAFSVAVSGSDVYMAGHIGTSTGTSGKVWKNGVLIESGYANASTVRSLFIDKDGDLYAAGNTLEGKAVVWKNGDLLYTLTVSTYNIAASVVVDDNGDVYTAGYGSVDQTKWVPGVFKNSTPIHALGTTGTSSFGTGNSMGLFVSNGAIYVAGNEYESDKYEAKLWKDGVSIPIFTHGYENSYACSVFVSGEDVYVAGSGNNTAALLWKNDERIVLSNGSTDVASSVFVVPEGNSIEQWKMDNEQLTIYPNPTTGQLTIDNGQLTIENVEVFDVYGRKQKGEGRKEKGERSMEIDISLLPAGVYFVKITTETGIITRKVINH